MTKIKSPLAVLLCLTTVVILLSGCSLRSEEKAPSVLAKATYQIIATTANKDISMQDIKPIIDYRARVKKIKDFQSEIVENKLIVTADPTQLTLSAANGLTEVNQLSIGESRKNFTADEITRKKTYNEAQKESMDRAHTEAKNNPENFGSILTTYSEDTDLTNHSVHDFQRKDSMQKEIAATLFSTGTGSITDMVTTDKMLWFAKVLDRQEQEEVTAQHILISYIGSQAKNPYLHRTKTQAEKFVNEIKDSITPQNFAAKAKELSDDSSNSGKGGSLGAFSRGQMAKAFEDAAFSGELNKVIGPITTEFGWHFIVVTKKESVPFVKYQDIVRFLKPLTPESGYVPVLHVGNKIQDIKPQVKSEASEIKPATGTGTTNDEVKKEYRLVITFSNNGRQMLIDFAKAHESLENLALMIDNAPYWKLTDNDQITSDGTLVLQGQLTEEQVREFSKQMKSYSLPTGIQLVDYEVTEEKK